MPVYTNLNGITGPNQQTILPQLKTNVAEFFNWGLLGRGFFQNISGVVSGVYGGDFSTLRLVNDPNYATGRVWEAPRINWIWETGVENGYSPTVPSGVYIGTGFYPSTGTGVGSHRINFPLGRVVFNTAISSASTVKCFHSSKQFQVGTEDQPWAKEIIFDTYRADKASGTQILASHRVQLPGMIIGTVPNRLQVGHALGGGKQVDQELYFYIYAETTWDRDKLIDIVCHQEEKTLYLYDTEAVAASGRFGLDLNGFKNTSGYNYADLVANFRNRTMYFKDSRVSEVVNNQPLFKAIVRMTAQITMLDI